MIGDESANDAAWQKEAEGWLGDAGLGSQAIEHAGIQRDNRLQSAIWTLSEARRIRADGELMADIRAWVVEKRAEFMLLLDDLG